MDWNILYKLCCVVQQRSRVKDLSFLVGYDESYERHTVTR